MDLSNIVFLLVSFSSHLLLPIASALKATFVDAKGQDKGQQAGDAKFEVHIDKKPVEYKEIANSKDARILQIDVSKNDRTIEII